MIIINEIIKNLRIIIRDRTSVGLLLIGPMIIILLTGFLFGKGLTVKHIKLGIYVNTESKLVDDMIDSMKDAGSIVRYTSLDSCLDGLRREKIHLCLDVKNDETPDPEQPHITVHMYSNITGSKMWAGSIVPQIQFLIEASSYRISVASTENFLDLIKSINKTLQDRHAVLKQFLTQLNKSNSILQSNKDALAYFQANFRDNSKKINSARQALTDQSKTITETIDTLSQQIDKLDLASDSLKSITKAITDQGQNATSLLTPLFGLPDNQDPLQEKAISEGLPFTLMLSNVHSTLGLLQTNTHLLKDEFSDLEKNVTGTANSINNFTKLLEREGSAEVGMLAQISETSSVLQSINSELDQDASKLSVFEGALASNLIRPIIQEHSPVRESRTIEVLLSIILVMFLTFITTIFATIISLEEINTTAHFRNIISPTSNYIFLLGAIITNCLLVGIQITTFFLVAQYQFQVDVFKHLPQLIAITSLQTVIFTMIGISVAYLIKKQQLSILVSVFIAISFFIFSNAFFPLELMPDLGAALAKFNPVGIAEQMSRLLILYEVPITDNPFNLTVLAVESAITLCLAFYANHRYVEKLK